MSLIDEVHGELARSLGLRPQSDWPSAILGAITACQAGASQEDSSTLRARIFKEVATRITVPETHFFRNHAQLGYCADHLSRTASREDRTSRMWCAGSATGEEPYTIAMLVDHLSRAPLKERLEITASDINSNAVAKALEATYTAWSFRGAPSWCFAYFEPAGSGLVKLKPSPIRDVVTFAVESCQAGAALRADSSLDVITFRNVAIYLEEQATQALYREFARLLRPGGLLAIGPSDPRPAAGLFTFLEYHDDAPVFVRERDASIRPAKQPAALVPSPAKTPAQTTPAPQKRQQRASRALSGTLGELHAAEVMEAENAFSVVHSLAQGDPDDPMALRLLGQAHLSRGEVAEATRVLRQAVFLSAEDALTRYFFALALREGGDTQKALRQLKNVEETLSSRGKDEKLSDQKTAVGDLLSAARFLEEQWT